MKLVWPKLIRDAVDQIRTIKDNMKAAQYKIIFRYLQEDDEI